MKPEMPLTNLIGMSIGNILDNDFDMTIVDPEQVLSESEQQEVGRLGKLFALSTLYREFLNQIKAHRLNVSGEKLTQHFVGGLYYNYRQKGVADVDKATEDTFEQIHSFLEGASDIAPDDTGTEITLEAVYATAFARNILPNCDAVSPVPQTKFSTVMYFGLALQESIKQTTEELFDKTRVLVQLS